MNKLLRSTGDFLRATPQVFLFELLYKLMLTALGAPLLTYLIGLAMKFSGISYLSGETIAKFLLNPVTILILLIILFVIAFFSIVEIAALIACFASLHERRRITVIGMLKAGFGAFGKAFRGMGIISFLGFMLIIPLTQFTLSSGVFFAPVLPMLRSLLGSFPKAIYIILFVILQLAIAYLLASRSYSIHYLVLTKHRFADCTKKSQSCLEGKKFKTALSLLLWSLFLIAAAAVITFTLSFLIVFVIKGFSKPESALLTSIKVLKYAGKVFTAVSAVISAPAIICHLTGKFFTDTQQEEQIVLPDTQAKKIPRAAKFAIILSAAAVSVFLNFSYIQAVYRGNVNLNISFFHTPQISAHRGFSYAAPENSGYAFEKAIEAGANYIELDVQQTADGQIVVFHDSKLNRTTDGTGYLNQYTYDEIQQFSCGSWFKKGEFADAKIMLLSEVLELYGDSILFNIEIKNFGDTTDTATKTAEIIIEYNITNSCYVTSFSYSALKTIKKINPHIKTGLISNMASTSVYSQLKYIDAISLNHIFVNQNTVSTAHKNGKKVFVWTVNNQSDMLEMVSLGVDNIITDRPDKAAEAVYSYSGGDAVISLLKWIFGT